MKPNVPQSLLDAALDVRREHEEELKKQTVTPQQPDAEKQPEPADTTPQEEQEEPKE